MYVQKSYSLKLKDMSKQWHLIDATGLTVGRLATQIADLLRGKVKPNFTPNQESGDYVIVTNCEKVHFTGKKWTDKVYFWHTNHIGGIKSRTAKEQLTKHPEKIILDAVRGMLPKTTLGRKQLTKLRVYVGDKHENEAQKPVVFQAKGK